MSDFIPASLMEILKPEVIQKATRIAIILVVGFIIIRIVSLLVGRITKRRLTAQTSMLVRKAINYTGAFFVLVAVLQQLGLKLTALLGAAGVVGIAVGFASQTSMSNLISGIFLISEKPFAVGDVIKIGDTVGIVLSIDLLSVKARKFDNQFVRIPNQQIIGTQLINITRFPIRRMDINLGVAYKEDLRRVQDVLMEVARRNPFCLDEPEPLVVFTNFGDSAIEILYALWFEGTDYLKLKNSIMIEIKEAFDREGIEIPFPHRTLYTGSATEPFPVQLVEGTPDAKAAEPETHTED
jgi:small-conductance mechanosensitive channel